MYCNLRLFIALAIHTFMSRDVDIGSTILMAFSKIKDYHRQIKKKVIQNKWQTYWVRWQFSVVFLTRTVVLWFYILVSLTVTLQIP
jgi:hypothetical protein